MPMTSETSHSEGPRTCPACGEACMPAGDRLGGYALFLCGHCGLRSAVDALDVPVDYDQVYSSDLYAEQTVEAMKIAEQDGRDAALIPTYAPFFRALKPEGGRTRLLDVGCGAGRFCRAAAHRGWKTLGIDVSEVALEHARAIERLEYQAIDLADVPGRCGRFDVVTAFEVVEHQSRVRRFLQLVRSALQPDGRFFCTVPAWEHPDVRSASRPDWIPPVHLLFFTRESLQEALAHNGFDVAGAGYIWMTPQALYPRIKWLAKRVLTRAERPLGIWALARAAGP